MTTTSSRRRTEAAQPIGADGARAERIRIEGLVQGVGFRVHVLRVARRHGMRGWVANVGPDVVLHACGPAVGFEAFVLAIAGEAPRLSRIDRIERIAADALPRDAGFVIH